MAPVALQQPQMQPIVVYGAPNLRGSCPDLKHHALTEHGIGTSILHGAGAGRAGMVYSSQMERYIRRPIINLGFSGHGLMQPEVLTLTCP
jgi:hypothetical protein